MSAPARRAVAHVHRGQRVLTYLHNIPEGLAVAAVMIACIIPVTNIACVAVLARWGADQRGVSPVARAP